MTEMANKESDFYQKLRQKMRSWLTTNEGKSNKFTEFLLVAPDLFHLLCKLMVEPTIAASDKIKLPLVIAYFISPIDLIPEGLVGPAGYVDDVVLAAYAIKAIIDIMGSTDPEVLKKNWAGDQDLLVTIKKIIESAGDMLSPDILSKLRNKIFGKNKNAKDENEREANWWNED